MISIIYQDLLFIKIVLLPDSTSTLELPEEGWRLVSGQPKYSTPFIKISYVESVSAFMFLRSS